MLSNSKCIVNTLNIIRFWVLLNLLENVNNFVLVFKAFAVLFGFVSSTHHIVATLDLSGGLFVS